jgi:hypothetical protein
MNNIVVAIVAMDGSAIGAVITALAGWARWSATRLSRRESLKITSSDGQAVKLVVDRSASDEEVSEVITSALRRLREAQEMQGQLREVQGQLREGQRRAKKAQERLRVRRAWR